MKEMRPEQYRCTPASVKIGICITRFHAPFSNDDDAEIRRHFIGISKPFRCIDSPAELGDAAHLPADSRQRCRWRRPGGRAGCGPLADRALRRDRSTRERRLRGAGGGGGDAAAGGARSLSLRAATALLADGRTASALVERARGRAGETVLVEAAAGGVGTLLLQLVRNAGARVIALARGGRKLAIARVMGAELAVDYAEDGWAGRVREAVGAVDVVFDGVGGETGRSAFELLQAGGRHVAFGVASGAAAPIPPEAAAARGVTLVAGLLASPEELLGHARHALTEAAAGRLRPLVGQEWPLADAAAAHRAIERRETLGKTLLVVGQLGRRAARRCRRRRLRPAPPRRLRRS